MIAKTVRLALTTAAAAALLSAADASAQTTVSSSFQVTASVKANCVIDAAADIAITTPAAPWDPTGTADPKATGTITVRCTRGTAYEIDLNGGTYADQMTHTVDATAKLPYKFYAGDCSTAFAPIAFTATSRAARNHTICAGLDGSATLEPIAGDYADTVVVDVTF